MSENACNPLIEDDAPRAAVRLSALDLKNAIAERYASPEWLVESEVTMGGRRLDVVAFNMWPAREHRVVGFEIKVDRGDWLRELQSFQKSEQWTEVVDAFYVVTPPKLVRADELPAGWGLLELTGSRMMNRAHAATKATGRTLPRELTARLLSRMLERSLSADRQAEFLARGELRRAVEEEVEKKHAQKRLDTQRRLEEAEAELREIYAAFGLQGRRWLDRPVALKAAASLAQADYDGAHRMLQVAAQTQARLLREKLAILEPLLAEFDAPQGS